MHNENFVTNFIEFYKHNNNNWKIKKFRGGWLILCPYHSDSDPSLAIYKNGGCYCFACKKPYRLEAIMSHYGFIKSDATPEFENIKPIQDETKIVDTRWYPYSNGDKSYFRLRIESIKNGEKHKTFLFYENDMENGKEVLKLVRGYIPLFLYHLPEIKDKSQVFFTEGEKCADALWEVGIPATTLPIGATAKINKDILQALLPLKGKTIYILPDKDDAGKRYAKSIAKALNKFGCDTNAKIVFVPDIGDKTDIADYIEFLRLQGFTDEEIKNLILNLTQDSGMPFNEIEPKQTEWCIEGWIPKGRLTILAGREGVGKTRLSLVLACAKANGDPIYTSQGFKQVEQGKVLYFTLEDDISNLAYWCDAVGLKRNSNMMVFDIEDFDTEDFDDFDAGILYRILNLIKKHKPELVIIDPASYLITEEEKLKGIKPILEPLVKIAKKENNSIVAVWHLNKRDTTNVGLAVSGHSRITAMAKRLIILEEQESNKIVAHFKKTQKTEPVGFIVSETSFEWIKDKDFGEFNTSIPKGKEVADLIRETLLKHPEGLNYSSIKKLVEPFNISIENLKIISHRYLKDIEKIPVTQKGKFVEWIWKLSGLQLDRCNSGANQVISHICSRVTNSKNVAEKNYNAEKLNKNNNLQEQKINNAKNMTIVTLEQTLENKGFITELHPDNCNPDDEPQNKDKDNLLKNKNFFKLTVPVVPSEFLKRHRLENSDRFENPKHRQAVIDHIVDYLRNNCEIWEPITW